VTGDTRMTSAWQFFVLGYEKTQTFHFFHFMSFRSN
jgi:hypothetical protein